MKKDISELPPDIQAQIRALADKPEDEINTDDIPEGLDWTNAKRGVFYRPVKQQITLRLDADVVSLVQGAPTRRARLSDGHQHRPARARAPQRRRSDHMTTPSSTPAALASGSEPRTAPSAWSSTA